MILITGSSGYLGGRIVEELSSEGKELILLRSDKPNKSPGFSEEFDSIELDLNSDISNINKIFPDSVDTVIHLASLNQASCEKNKKLAYQTNVEGTKKLLEVSKNKKIKRFINFSTCQIYGNNKLGLISEDSPPNPENTYAHTHLQAENETLEFTNFFEIVNLRISNSIGTPINQYSNCWHLFANDLCKAAIRTKRIEIHSPPSVTRDFIPISLVLEVINFFTSVSKFDSSFNKINVCSNQKSALIDVALLIKQRFKKIFNEEIDLISKKNASLEIEEKFSYSNLRLIDLNLKAKMEITEEIDKLLINCSKWFGNV